MRCPGQAPTRHIVSLRSRCATLSTNGGGMKTRDVLASASEAIHGSAAQDRRWISSSLRPAMTESNRPLQRRHHRACPGDPRPGFATARKSWMAGTSARSKASSPRPAMTTADSRLNCLTATPPRSRGAKRPSFTSRFARLKHQRAQGMPGAQCARSLACKIKKHTSIVTTVTPD